MDSRDALVVPELPIEIWEQITAFLPERFVQSLYSVNRPLRSIALNSRYKTAVVGQFAQDDVERTLRNPTIRGRARKMVICDLPNDTSCSHPSCHIPHRDSGPRTSQPGLIQQALIKLQLFKGRSQWEAQARMDGFYDQMMELAHEMNCLQEVVLRLASGAERQCLKKLQFTRAVLGASSDRITKLELNCALEDLQHVVTSDLCFPALSTLCLGLRTLHMASDVTEVFSTLQAFLKNHYNSVVDLELSFSRLANTSSFLLHLPRFPRLSGLVLVFHTNTLCGDAYSGINHFVSQHKSQLRHMGFFVRPHPFVPMNPSNGIETNAADLALLDSLGLRSLTLGSLPQTFPGNPNIDIKRYLQRYQSTLTSLQLFTHHWTHLRALRTFSGLTLNLERLAFTINRLSPKLLSLLASTFPTLEELVVNIKFGVASEGASPVCKPALALNLVNTHPSTLLTFIFLV
ncbi:hypothetical protein BJ165DRAFT_1479957 [Panaeolus papilionaceus]|nr:hypothetical protein BJ165DRAFT_1479957 [Panaeolus papilionaceus]